MTIYVDGLAVENEAEAERLMLYHLKLAAALFEATSLNVSIPENEFARKAFIAFCEAMDALYDSEDVRSEMIHHGV